MKALKLLVDLIRLCVYEVSVGLKIHKFKEDNILASDINLFSFLVISDFAFPPPLTSISAKPGIFEHQGCYYKPSLASALIEYKEIK